MSTPGLASPSHLLLLLLIALLLFGGKRLPEIGRSLGSGVREFRQSFGRAGPPSPPPTTDAPADAVSPRQDEPGEQEDRPTDSDSTSKT